MSRSDVLYVLIALVIMAQFIILLPLVRDHKRSGSDSSSGILQKSSLLFETNLATYQSRIAVIIPYLGDHLPVWFDTFALTAEQTSPLIDWFILVTEAPMRQVPVNVKLIRISRSEIYNRFASLDERGAFPEEYLSRAFGQLITEHPYILVEFKACLGHLFSDLITHHTHWAYADLDILLGDVTHHITQQDLDAYDVITFSFGDNYRLYLRGQLSVFKNNERMNNLWRGCPHFVNLGQRLQHYLEGSLVKDSTRKVVPSGWQFQSAEGCISRVVMDASNVTVLFLPSQMSDAFAGPLQQKESLFFGGGQALRCYESGVSFGNVSDRSSTVNNPQARQPVTIPVHSASSVVGGGTDVWTPLYRVKGRCSYWIEPKYDVCVSEVPADAIIVKDSQGVVSYTQESAFAWPTTSGSCRQASFVHFQGWKRAFYAFITRIPSADTHVMLVTDCGFIPLRAPHTIEANGVNVGKSMRGGVGAVSEWLISFGDMYTSNAMNLGRVSQQSLLQQPNAVITVKSDVSKRPRQPQIAGKPGVVMSNYCYRYDPTRKSCLSFIPLKNIVVVEHASTSTTTNTEWADADTTGGDRITLITVASSQGYYSGLKLESVLNGWDGPKIVVLAVGCEPQTDFHHDNLQPTRQDRIVIHVDICSCINNTAGGGGGAAAGGAGGDSVSLLLPDNMLFNIGLDVAETDLVCLLPAATAGSLEFNVNSKSAGDSVAMALSQLFVHAQQQLAAPNTLTGNGKDVNYPPAVALVIPMFTHKQSSADVGGQQKSVLVPYPDSTAYGKEAQCGSEQPWQLAPKPEQLPDALTVNQMASMHRHTLMLPLLFNRSASPHGRGFARFPEELNGPGCYGSFVLRVLFGAGYTLRWAAATTDSLTTASAVYVTIRSSGDGLRQVKQGVNKHTSVTCGCMNNGSESIMREMIARFNRYFDRAELLRKTGIEDVYSRVRFGVGVEENTMKN